MAMSSQPSQPGSLRGLLQSYGRDLRGWAGNITLRYAIAAVLLLSGGAGVVAAIGVGIAALFHWLETAYSASTAYAVVIGLLLFLGIVSILTAVLLLRQALPPLPRPHRHAAAAGRSLSARAMLAAAAPRQNLAKADPVTEVMIGLAAACLMGWLVSSRLAQTRGRDR